MEFLALLVAIVSIAIASTKSSQIKYLENDVKLLKKRTRDLHDRLLELSSKSEYPKVKPSIKEERNTETVSLNINKDIQHNRTKVVKEKVIKAKDKSKTLLLNKFIEEWAGAIGVISLVMGLAFLGIYSAAVIIKEPFYRFLIFVLYTGLILGGSIFLSRKQRWRVVALWLRSAAGAVFLFLCIASSAPNIKGLFWVDNSVAGLFLLLTGVVFNLYLGYLSKKEIVASIHVFLSLLAIAIAPSSTITLVVAAFVVLFGLYLTFKEKWDLNLILIMTFFFLFHLKWKAGLQDSDINATATGLIAVFIVFLCCLCSHYRKVYSVTNFEILPFFSHFLNWVYLAVGIYIYLDIIPFKIILLFSGSIIALLISKRAKKLNIRWLYVTDTMFANLLMIIGIISLYNRGVNLFSVVSILFVESIIFLTVMSIEKEILLSKIGYFIVTLLGVILFALNLELYIRYNGIYPVDRTVINLLLLLLTSGMYVVSLRKSSFFKLIDNKLLKIAAFLPCLSVYSIFLHNKSFLWSPYLFILLFIPIVIYRERIKNNYLYYGLCLVLTLVKINSWIVGSDLYPVEAYVYCFPLFIASLVLIKYSKAGNSNNVYLWPLILLQLHLIISVNNIFSTVSIYLPGILWLFISILHNELSGSIKKLKLREYQKKLPDFIVGFGFIYILVFFANHFVHTIHSEEILFGIKIRYLIEILGFLVLLYWVFRDKKFITKEKKNIYIVKSLMIELLYVYFIFIVFLEVKDVWQPVIWISFAVTSLFIKSKKLERVKFYSIFLGWLSAAHLSLITSVAEDSGRFIQEKWITGILTILIYIAYLVLVRSRIKEKVLEFPVFMSKTKELSLKIFKNTNQWIYYPFFICVAFFILFTFNKNVITLLFVIESLIIFLLSMVLKEDNFKLISMLGILGVMVRLLFFDLRNSSTITRPLVFIGVGIVLVLMNVIYMKFKDKSEQ